MTDANIFSLVQIIRSAKGDPSAITDAIWEAGYRQPERSAEEAAKITLDAFHYGESFGMPADFWPDDYDSVLQNELMKAVLAEYEDCGDFDLEPVVVARRVIKAGFRREVSND